MTSLSDKVKFKAKINVEFEYYPIKDEFNNLNPNLWRKAYGLRLKPNDGQTVASI